MKFQMFKKENPIIEGNCYNTGAIGIFLTPDLRSAAGTLQPPG
jgi:hypothetical protein